MTSQAPTVTARAPVAPSDRMRKPVPPARHLLRARDLADARYTEPLGVDDLARAAGLSGRTSAASSAARSGSRRTPTC